jgi:hypothetical protein
MVKRGAGEHGGELVAIIRDGREFSAASIVYIARCLPKVKVAVVIFIVSFSSPLSSWLDRVLLLLIATDGPT